MAAEGGGIAPFHVPTFIFQTLNVALVVFVLYKVLFKPVADVLARRESFVENSLAQAAATKKEAESLLVEYQRMMANAKQDADNILAQATKQGEELKREMIAQAEEEAFKIFQRARADIQKEKEKVLMDIRSEIANLTVFATSKLLDRVITVEDNERIVRSCVDQLDSAMNIKS
ncbi:MAG TPA: F0F1 ATP synthase subunit B [Firmicutes bacterium]|nr:F0F1 ATP synthase subunit B [Bacillota bacterium]